MVCGGSLVVGFALWWCCARPRAAQPCLTNLESSWRRNLPRSPPSHTLGRWPMWPMADVVAKGGV
eukprot:3306322-Prymnesium_polylepis.2